MSFDDHAPDDEDPSPFGRLLRRTFATIFRRSAPDLHGSHPLSKIIAAHHGQPPSTEESLPHHGPAILFRETAAAPLRDISDHLAMILYVAHRDPRRRCIIFRRCAVVPPRHHVPCSSFDAHARARLTAPSCRSSLSSAPIHDRGPLHARSRLATTPFTSAASVHLSVPAQPHADDDS